MYIYTYNMYMYIYIYVYLFVYPFIHLFVYLFDWLMYLLIYLFICVCAYVCMYIYIAYIHIWCQGRQKIGQSLRWWPGRLTFKIQRSFRGWSLQGRSFDCLSNFLLVYWLKQNKMKNAKQRQWNSRKNSLQNVSAQLAQPAHSHQRGPLGYH